MTQTIAAVQEETQLESGISGEKTPELKEKLRELVEQR